MMPRRVISLLSSRIALSSSGLTIAMSTISSDSWISEILSFASLAPSGDELENGDVVCCVHEHKATTKAQVKNVHRRTGLVGCRVKDMKKPSPRQYIWGIARIRLTGGGECLT